MAFIMDPILLAEPEELELIQRYRDQRAARQDITRQHWAKDGDHGTCTGCRVDFTLFQRRSHCRKCGLVFCKSCTKYKLPLNRKAEYEPSTGTFYKVCFRCAELQTLGQTRSHTDYFRRERGQTHGRSNHEERDHSSVPRYAHPKIYIKLLEKFNADLQAPDNKSRIPATVKNTVQRARLATRCATAECRRQLLLPQDRKLCVTCEEVFCRQCSAKDVVVFRPDDDPECEARVSIAQTVKVTTQVPGNSRAYRVCVQCRGQLHRHCQSHYFHRDLVLCQAQLLDLQAQISPALDRGTDEQNLKRLFDQYQSKLFSIKDLEPSSDKEHKLKRRVCQGVTDFYNTRKNIFRHQ